jgi:hypothetical protein
MRNNGVTKEYCGLSRIEVVQLDERLTRSRGVALKAIGSVQVPRLW